MIFNSECSGKSVCQPSSAWTRWWVGRELTAFAQTRKLRLDRGLPEQEGAQGEGRERDEARGRKKRGRRKRWAERGKGTRFIRALSPHF